jgi:hypothetical protein
VPATTQEPPRPYVPWWGVASSVTAPVALAAGWIVAAALQARPYSPVRQTVSVLAAHGSSDRWVMTLAFVIVGGCDVITGLAVRQAALPGRIILIIGGFAGMLVGANPETIGAGGSWRHALFAAIGFVTLTIWPAAATRRASEPGGAGPGAMRGGAVPWALRRPAGVVASGLTLVLFAWFCVELVSGGGQLGLAERVLGEMQALWPLVVVVSSRIGARTVLRPPTTWPRHPADRHLGW